MADTRKSAKKPQKIFGVMTKRRWFGVVVFLSAMLWSYTAGPPLSDSVICNRYFLDGTSYDYKTVAFEGDMAVIESVFKRGFWPDVFTWQIGAYFDWTEGPLWSSKHSKLLFSDTVQNSIFSWSPINGIQLELENAGEVTDAQRATLAEPGTNGLLQHPHNADVIFVAQHAQRRIVRLDLNTKQRVPIADKFDGKALNSPNDMVLSPDGEYIYFTDPPYGLRKKDEAMSAAVHARSDLGFSGLFRVKMDGSAHGDVELIDRSMERPNGLAFSSDGTRLFVSDCFEGEFRMSVLTKGKKGKWAVSEKWTEEFVTRNSKGSISALAGGMGCVDGFAVLDSEVLVSTCPGGKLCVLKYMTGELVAVVKLPDKTKLANVAVGDDRNLYVTGNHTVWQIKLQPKS